MYVYVLQLENNKWYVGKTQNITKRYEQHMKGKGAVWTKMNKPICVHSLSEDEQEDQVVIRTMKEYGITNVRGGSFCKEYLTNSEIQLLERMIHTIDDACFRCGDKTHFAKNCNQDVCKLCEKRNHNIEDCPLLLDIIY